MRCDHVSWLGIRNNRDGSLRPLAFSCTESTWPGSPRFAVRPEGIEFSPPNIHSEPSKRCHKQRRLQKAQFMTSLLLSAIGRSGRERTDYGGKEEMGRGPNTQPPALDFHIHDIKKTQILARALLRPRLRCNMLVLCSGLDWKGEANIYMAYEL